MRWSLINTTHDFDISANNEMSIIDKLNKGEVERLIPVLIFFFLVVIIGTPGNVVVCYIYGPHTHSSGARWFNFVLGVIASFCCGVIVPFEIAASFYQCNFENELLCKIVLFLNVWSTLAFALTLVFISIDRYRKTCMRDGWQINLKIARILSIITAVVCFLMAIPGFAARGIYHREMNEHNITAFVCTFRNSDTSSYKFWYIVCGGVLFIASLVTICVMYSLIGAKVLQRIWQNKLVGQEQVVSMTLKNESNSSGNHQPVKSRQSTQEPVVTNQFSNESTSASNFIDGQPIDEIPSAEIRAFLTRKSTNVLSTTKSIHQRAKVRKATLSMFLISIAFLVSYLPNLCLLTLRSSQKDYEENLPDSNRVAYRFFLRFYYFNCVINPFIYGISDSFFRSKCKDIFKTLFGRCCGKKS